MDCTLDTFLKNAEKIKNSHHSVYYPEHSPKLLPLLATCKHIDTKTSSGLNTWYTLLKDIEQKPPIKRFLQGKKSKNLLPVIRWQFTAMV
jgi:hypothetical protein